MAKNEALNANRPHAGQICCMWKYVRWMLCENCFLATITFIKPLVCLLTRQKTNYFFFLLFFSHVCLWKTAIYKLFTWFYKWCPYDPLIKCKYSQFNTLGLFSYNRYTRNRNRIHVLYCKQTQTDVRVCRHFKVMCFCDSELRCISLYLFCSSSVIVISADLFLGLWLMWF